MSVQEKPTFKLEVFEGPLDILLSLIQKNKIDLLDIPIALITDQYMEYIAQMPMLDPDSASDFLQMAAHLLQIKSKLLLPKTDADQEEDPRAQLVEQLMEYQKVKEAAQLLREIQNSHANLFFKTPEILDKQVMPIENKPIPLQELLYAIADILERQERKAPAPRSGFRGIVGREKVSVSDMSARFKQLLEQQGEMLFCALFQSLGSRAEIVAGFLAVLEMIKLGSAAVYSANGILMIKNGDNHGIEIGGIGY